VTDLAEQYRGEVAACSHCGRMVVVPLPSGGSAADDAGAPSSRGSRRWLAFVMALLGGLLMVIVISLMLPPIGAPREAGRRMQCINNLRRIGLAMRSYEHEHGCFPPSFVPDENGAPKHSWRVLLLPFLGEDVLYRQYRFDEPWNGAHNKELAERMPAVYRCPTHAAFAGDAAISSRTSYAMIVGPRAISDGPTARKATDVRDGLSTTIMVAECAGADINWLQPHDLNAQEIASVIGVDRHKKPQAGISSYHPGVVTVLFCDGAVRALHDSVDNRVLEAALTINGGEPINSDDLRQQ
jgi:prepilin-type processing-associated H-X9-DG protein